MPQREQLDLWPAPKRRPLSELEKHVNSCDVCGVSALKEAFGGPRAVLCDEGKRLAAAPAAEGGGPTP